VAIATPIRSGTLEVAARPGNTRVTGKEQFYTPPETATHIFETLELLIPDLKKRALLEPAGGTGTIINAARAYGIRKVLSYDIEPHHRDVVLGNFFDQSFARTDLLTVSNPPFGRNNSLSIPFFNHAAQFSSHIVFIVPRSWRKWSVQNKLDRDFHLVLDEDLAINYVDVNGADVYAKDRLRTCIQFWERRDSQRPLHAVRDMGVISKVAPREADISLTVFGYGCGTVRKDFARVKNTTQMYLKLNHPKAFEAISNVDLSRFYMNTAYTEALSLPEINYALNEYIFGDPMSQA